MGSEVIDGTARATVVDLREVLTGDGPKADFAAVSFACAGGRRHVVAFPGDGDKDLARKAVRAFASHRGDLDRGCCEALDVVWECWHTASRESRLALVAAIKSINETTTKADRLVVETWDAVPTGAGNAP